MHSEFESFAEKVAEKQKLMWEAQRRLDESMTRFRNANVDAPSYYAVSEEHRRIFDEWVARHVR